MENNFFAVSIMGASHIKSGKPMQDYSLAFKGEDYCVGVVCDGHGADKHFRSEIGSKFAAEVTAEKFAEIAKQFPTWDLLKNNLKQVSQRVKLAILADWHAKIEQYTKENPFTEDELKKASKSFALKRHYTVAQPYGTTILGALVTEEYYFALMIGDGAMFKILPGFKTEIVVFPGKKIYDDEPHSATDSLCEDNAYNNMFICCNPIEKEEYGVAFGMCSDGMSEAFTTDEVLIKKVNNYFAYYAEVGIEKATLDITAQLNNLSAISPMKDDISLAFATNHLELYKSEDGE